jgi:O-antigen/teichoic acid export membrane protein
VATGSAPPDSERAPNSAEASGDGAASALHSDTAGKRILTNTLFRGIADVGSKIVSVAFFVALARLLGRDGFGVFTFGLAYATIITVLAGFGQDVVLTRVVARDRSRVDDYFTNTIALKLVVAVPVLVVATGVEWLVGMDSTTVAASALISLAVLAELLVATCFGVFQGYERLEFMPIVIVAQRVVTTAVAVAAMAAGAGVVVVSAIYLAGAAGAFWFAFLLLRRYVVQPAVEITPRRWPALMRVAVPVGIALVLQVLLFRIDAAILKVLEPIRVVGDYGAAYRVFESCLFLGWAVGAAVYPVFARIGDDASAIRLVYERSLKLVLALSIPAAVAAVVLARPAIEFLYGTGYENSARPLRILAPTIVLASVNHVTGLLLLALNRQRYIAIAFGVLGIENIAANFALIPWLSLNGAALNTTLTELLLVTTLGGYSLRLTGRPEWLRLLAGPMLGGAAAAATMSALHSHLLAALAAGSLSYAAVLASVEWLAYPDDARVVWRFIRRSPDAAAA